MATETGWIRQWPTVDDYYWRRIFRPSFDEDENPTLVRIVGDTCRFTDGSTEGRYECYEFLRVASPSDAQQLMELRRAATEALKWFRWYKSSLYPSSAKPVPSGAVMQSLEAALNPDLQKETQ